MKKTTTFLLILMTFAQVFAQEPDTNSGGTVEKSIFTVQIGSAGFWASNELRLADKFALRTEAGLDLWVYETFSDGDGAVLAPSISVEPRWYYNIGKRARKGKHTENNSANFVALAIDFYPNLFLLGNPPDYLYIPNQISFIPKWGIRRAIAKSNFNYELGFGIGYQKLLENPDYMLTSTENVAVDIHIRFGYTF